MFACRGVLVAVASLAIVASGTVASGPARAEGRVAGCHWIDREYDSTYTCEDFFSGVTRMQIVECWKYPPSARTFVRQKTPGGWVRNPLVTVKITGTQGCTAPYPHRTIVTIESELLTAMEVTRVRLTMPASQGTLPDGTPYRFAKTVMTYGACAMPEDAGDWCPQR
ncbi:MAG: hypothetical protein WEA35_04935 [Candidatus Nanopelagicales bacterium]